MGWYSQFWWKEELPDLTCTVEQRESALLYTLAVTDEVFIDKGQANLTISAGIVRRLRLYLVKSIVFNFAIVLFTRLVDSFWHRSRHS